MNRIEFGDCRETMRRWAQEGVKVQTCVTSPPYFGLRDYGHEGQIGLEQTPEEYIAAMVEVFRCVKDVLADDGTLWLNIGDSYWSDTLARKTVVESMWGKRPASDLSKGRSEIPTHNRRGGLGRRPDGIKPKDLMGIPWMLAFALRADGWYLRQDIIWHKPNPMPEAVKDRCTKAHEYIFLLSKSDKYYYDYEAVKVEASQATLDRNKHGFKGAFKGQFSGSPIEKRWQEGRPIESPEFSKDGKANRRSVWTVTTKPYKGAHFATFPPDLIEPCILAGSREGDIVLDPFMGSGTTAQVALKNGRQYLGCELNEDYKALQDERIAKALPEPSPQIDMFAEA